MSYIKNYQHIVFRTDHSQLTIPEESKRIMLAYINEICKNEKVFINRINAYLNHVHILADIPHSVAIPDLVRLIKSRTSLEFKFSPNFPDFRGWAKGYGSFSVSYYEVEHITNYIKSQEVHHQTHSYEDEFTELLLQNGIAPDKYTFAD